MDPAFPSLQSVFACELQRGGIQPHKKTGGKENEG